VIAVTGAAGKTGRAVIRALASRGAPVRALVRRSEQIAAVQAAGATQAVEADLLDQAALTQAMDGATSVYHVCPNMHPDEVSIGRAVVDAARTAGLARIVYHSVLHPQTESMPHHWNKLRVEEHLFECTLPYTILQPAAYMQNLLASWESIARNGIYRVPYAAETKLGMVDLADVAEVAARALTEPGHEYAVYELAGLDVLDQREVAAALGRRLRRPVRVEAVPLAQWSTEARQAGLGEYQITTLCQMFTYYERHGFWGNPGVLTWLLGRPPTSLASFLDRVDAAQATGGAADDSV
jgi:NAD(P)H dehydrogenase (quinone)